MVSTTRENRRAGQAKAGRMHPALRTVAKGAGAAIASGALLLGGAGVGTAETAARPTGIGTMACGFYETNDSAYYGHCGKTTVMIRIEHHNPFTNDWYRCVRPGETRLGTSAGIAYAVYVGGVGCRP